MIFCLLNFYVLFVVYLLFYDFFIVHIIMKDFIEFTFIKIYLEFIFVNDRHNEIHTTQYCMCCRVSHYVSNIRVFNVYFNLPIKVPKLANFRGSCQICNWKLNNVQFFRKALCKSGNRL